MKTVLLRSLLSWLVVCVLLCWVALVPAILAQDMLNINTASIAELDSLPGISRAIAERIVDYRNNNGPFTSAEQLLEVNGIGSKTLEKFGDLIVFFDVETGTGTEGSTMARPAPVPAQPTVDQILARFAHEPTIAEVQRAAIKHAGIHIGDIEKWRRNVRLQAFVPGTTFRFDKYDRENSTYRLSQNIDFRDEPDRYILGPDEYTISNYDYEYWKYQIGFDWDLNEFVYSNDQLKVRDEAEDLIDFKMKIVEEVTRLYFDRRRLQIDMLLESTGNRKASLDKELRLEEMTALLDSMTGGYFLEQIEDQEPGHTAQQGPEQGVIDHESNR
ncbi:helix-hairpin-helix domain-containing protein [bacterium]|nr:helix-hairpin-helix domain-containing protein [bacterium]